MAERKTGHDESDGGRVAAARGGDAEAFQRLVERHYGMVFAIAYARLGNAEAAEDAAQEAFLRAWLHLRRLEDPARFAPWVARIARNLAADWAAAGGRGDGLARRLARALPLEAAPEAADPSDAGARAMMEREEELDWLRRAIGELPAEQREMVLLHYMEGLSKKEIAERLEVHPSTVVRQMRAALAALKRQLEPVLRRAAARLRPAPVAAGRAGAVIAMAAMLTAAQQARLAAAAPVAEAPLVISSAPASPAAPSLAIKCVLAIVEAVLGLLKPLAALGGAGGKAMGLGKILFGLGVLAALGGGGAFYWHYRIPSPEGLYIWPVSNEGYTVVIGRDSRGNPRIERPAGSAWRLERTREGYAMLRNVQKEMDQLGISYMVGSGHFKAPDLLPDPQTGRRIWNKEYVIVPSRSVPGDWDALEVALYKPKEYFAVATRLKRPLPSMLHRVGDPRALELIDQTAAVREQEWQPEAGKPETANRQHPPLAPHEDLVQLAATLAREHPGDLFIEMLYLDALIAARDFKTLEVEITRVRPQYQRPSFLRVPFRNAEWTLRAWQQSLAGKNAYELAAQLQTCDLATRIAAFPEFLRYESYAMPLRSVWNEPEVPNLLETQQIVKVMNVAVVFDLLLGRRDEALQLLAASYRLGQLLGREEALIANLIGVAVRAIVCRGLEHYALNACETPQEIQHFWQWLEYFNQRELPLPDLRSVSRMSCLFRADAFSNFFGFFADPDSEWLDENVPTPHYEELFARHSNGAARFQLVRMGTAARGHQLATRALPRSAGEFGPLLPAGLPRDPFSGEPLRMAANPGGIVCYSVGPDRQDDGGAITYDPSNGTVSRGDVTLEVPRAKKYPFPRGGVRARTKDELLAQFPNGLPPDPFADTRGKPLGVSEGFPVYVYSYGPDGDENVRSVTHPQAAYDPTNGTSSDGDLFIQIPER